jgi:hypothetical protein
LRSGREADCLPYRSGEPTGGILRHFFVWLKLLSGAGDRRGIAVRMDLRDGALPKKVDLRQRAAWLRRLL